MKELVFGHLDVGRKGKDINRAFGLNSGAEVDGEYVVAFWWVYEEVDLGKGDRWLLFTPQRFGFGQGRYARVFSRSSLSALGVGESHHVQYHGTGSTPHWLLSFTISMMDMTQYTRHTLLGTNESEVNRFFPQAIESLKRLARVGYPIVDGPGWNSTGGYTTSYGVGFFG